MRQLQRIFLAAIPLLLALATGGCRATPQQEGGCYHDTLSIGNGGGFTGSYAGYRLLGNGEVWFWTTDARGRDSSALVTRFGMDTTNYLFSRLHFIGFSTIDFNAPGNLTRVLVLSAPNRTHTVRWGDLTQKPPEEITRYFDDITALIRGRIGK